MLHRLTRYELEIMDIVWRSGEVTVQAVCDSLTRPLAYTSVMTTMSLLERKKKVLERTKRGRAYVYRPTVTREEVSRSLLAELQQVLFGDSLPSLVLSLVADGKFSDADRQALKAALERVERSE